MLLTIVSQLVYIPGMEVLPTDDELRAWDWLADLRADDRHLMWLSRKTETHYMAVYRYSWGHQEPPIEWLRKVAHLLGRTR